MVGKTLAAELSLLERLSGLEMVLSYGPIASGHFTGAGFDIFVNAMVDEVSGPAVALPVFHLYHHLNMLCAFEFQPVHWCLSTERLLVRARA